MIRTCFGRVLMRFGCVSDVLRNVSDLRIGVPGATNHEEADFEVRLALAPPKPSKNCKKLTFRSKNFATTNFCFRKMKSR